MQYKITVKQYMLKKSTPDFDFMKKWNNDNPMPLCTMVGEKLDETRGMVKMSLHGDIFSTKTMTCMKCGKPITNEVSQYFGLGPVCGGHNYTNPFATEAELKAAVSEYKKKLQHTTWEGWIIKSAILEKEPIGNDAEEEQVFEEPKKSFNTIKVRVDKPIKGVSNISAFLSFPYDNFVIAIIKNLQDRYWHPDTKEWEISATDVTKLQDSLKNYTFDIDGEIPKIEQTVITPAELPADFHFKTKPFEHQIEGVNYGLSHDRWLLGDEQGLGKTKQVIDIAVAKKLLKGYKHCLIVCGVNGLKWNWLNEIHTHSNEQGWILGQKNKGGKLVIGSTHDKMTDVANIDKIPAYFLITNVETLRNKEIAEALQKRCADGTIGIVAIDEIHKCKNPSSQQGKGILKIQPECRIAITGTPLMNSPLDLYIILKWLGYEKHAFYSFRNHYCVMGGYGGYEILQYKNLDELQDHLNAIMLRRLKSETLDLPEKLPVDEFVEMTPKQAQVYKEVDMNLRSNIDKIAESPNPLAMLIRLRQATGYTGILSTEIKESAKLDRMEELVDEAIDNGKKVVIFSNWTQMTDVVSERLRKKYHTVVITGDTKDSDRQAYVDAFQTDNKVKVAIGTIGAMGTGITLTAGSVMIFLDEPWNTALKDQAIDRCHRIGTKENLTIYTIMAHGTIDERIHDIVMKKGLMADAIVDGKIVGNSRELLNYLLS